MFQPNDSTVSADAVTEVLNHGALDYTIGMRGFYFLCRWPCGCSVRMDAGGKSGFGCCFNALTAKPDTRKLLHLFFLSILSSN